MNPKSVLVLRYYLSAEASYTLSKDPNWAGDFLEWSFLHESAKITTSQHLPWRWIGFEWPSPQSIETLIQASDTLRLLLLKYLKKPALLPNECEIKGLRL